MRIETPEAMLAAGERLGRVVAAGDAVALVGELGAGKTVLVKGVARGAAVPPAVPVTSPTFTLVNEYKGGRVRLFHVDLYRLEHESELEDVGLDDLYRQEAAVLVEWFDRFPGAAPPEYLEIRIAFAGGETRVLEAEPHGEAAARLLERWRQA